MAIALISVPETLSPAFNQQIYNVSSTNAGQPNFNFLADIYVSNTLVSRLVYPKQPNVNTLKFDAMPVLKNYVSYDLENVLQTTSMIANTNSEKDYFIQFGEIYDVSGVSTIASSLLRSPSGSNVRKIFNWIFDFEEAVTPIDVADYDITATDKVLYVTPNLHAVKVPKYTIKPNQKLFTSLLDITDSAVQEISVTSGLLAADLSVAGVTGKMHYNASIGWDLLDLLFTQNERTQIINNGYYLITFNPSSLASIYVSIDNCADKYEVIRLHWLNNIGGWESFNFTKNSNARTEINRTSFKKIQSLGYNMYDRLKTTFNTRLTDKVVINSDWLNDEMLIYMETLAVSPVVFWEKQNGNIISVNVTNSQYDTQKYLNGRQLYNVSFEIEPTYNRYRQSL